MEIVIPFIGALAAVSVSIIAAFLSYNYSKKLQLRRLKEEHYIAYIEALHNLCADNKSRQVVGRYTFHRDKMFIIANEEVVKSILCYEENTLGNNNAEIHDRYLTDLIKTIRKDLGIKDKDFPGIFFKKA